MTIGIVGSESAKFTPETEKKARDLIRQLVNRATVICSGHCHLGGIDIWAEEIADELGIPKLIFPPLVREWNAGYKRRNILIARNSDEVHCITIKKLPDNYKGMRFSFCYHCNTNEHVKSGGCWTVKYAIEIGKIGVWHVIE